MEEPTYFEKAIADLEDRVSRLEKKRDRICSETEKDMFKKLLILFSWVFGALLVLGLVFL